VDHIKNNIIMGAGIAKESLTNLTDHIPNLGGFHCAMIGLDSAGKTTVLYRLKFNQYMNTAPTIGFNCEKVRFGGSSFTLWDVGGQDKLRPYWRHYFTGTQGIVFVVDAADRGRLAIVRDEMANVIVDEQLQDAVFLIFANKQDIPGALNAEQITKELNLEEMLKDRAWHVQEAQAKDATGLSEGFEWLCETMKVL